MLFFLQILSFLLLGVVVLFAASVWWKRRLQRPEKYDLRTLFDEPVGEAYDDMVQDDSGPYCSSCDEPHAAGAHFCRWCGRPFG